ncbi:MAG: hypothetical protein HOC95_02895 [Candidatus Diapherotrites archaeon]|nr:hypothetical protein [Candidatus Diapherotrites archaeon]
MRARFEVRSIKSQWKPPFKKEITDEVFDVNEGEGFDKIVGNGNNESVFKLITAESGNANVEYSKLFTLKTHNPGNYKLILVKDTPIEMTYLWGEDGMTKKITFKGVVGSQPNYASPPTNSETEQ